MKSTRKEFLKLVCVDENNPLEYLVLEDINRDNLDEVHDFVKKHFDEHPDAKWILIPCYM